VADAGLQVVAFHVRAQGRAEVVRSARSEYLAEIKPDAGFFPADIKARAHCRSVSGEMHSGFANL